MRISATPLEGLMLVEVEAHADERGLFARTYDADEFAAAGLPTDWPQCNTSFNLRRRTLRGMHYQDDPAPEPKLVRCTAGEVFDVAVDLRRDSPTHCRWFGVELSAAKRNALYVPPGFAHGFLTLVDECEVFYQMGGRYSPGLGRGVRWNDPAFGIVWPFAPVVIAERDAQLPDYLK